MIELVKDYNERNRIAERQRIIVDGNGAKRIVEMMKGVDIDAV